jgi:hypothetical protein
LAKRLNDAHNYAELIKITKSPPPMTLLALHYKKIVVSSLPIAWPKGVFILAKAKQNY